MTSEDRKEHVQPLDLLIFLLNTGWGWGDRRRSGSPGGGVSKWGGTGKDLLYQISLFVCN